MYKKLAPICLVLILILCVFALPVSALNEQQKLTASDGVAEDRFGVSVCISGNTALIGAPWDENGTGSAYVFRYNGSTWAEEQKLTANDGAAGDYFGYSVSISDNTALIGRECSGNRTGSAYVFRYDGSTWEEEQKLTASDSAAMDYFGYSVSISDNTALIGAECSENHTGSAYVFRYDGYTWVEEQKLTASDRATWQHFGNSVSISDNTALIGAPLVEGYTGSAYIFRYDGSTWVEEQKLIASDGATWDEFGNSVSISGNTALIAADCSGNRTGSAYVFRYDGSTWAEEQKLTASDGVAMDYFGGSISISDNTALIGAPWDENGTGSAYVFRYDGSTWVEEQKLTASDGAPGDKFGSVSISDNAALIGAPWDKNGTGSAYIFQAPPLVRLDYDCSTIPEESPAGVWQIAENWTKNSEWYSEDGLLFIDAYGGPGGGDPGAIFYREEASLAVASRFEMEVRACLTSYYSNLIIPAIWSGFMVGDGVKGALVWTGPHPEKGQVCVNYGHLVTDVHYSDEDVTDWFSFNTYHLVVDKSDEDPGLHIAQVYVNDNLALTVNYTDLMDLPLTYPFPRVFFPEESALFTFGGTWSDTEWDFVSYEVYVDFELDLSPAIDYIPGLPDDAFSNLPELRRAQLSIQLNSAESSIDLKAYTAALEKLYNVYQKMDGSLTPDNLRDDLNDWVTDPDAQEYLTTELRSVIYQLLLLDRPEMTGRQSSPSLELIDPQPSP
jgi:hypothetical protein